MSLLNERIDIIFVRGPSFLSLALVTGRVPIFPLNEPPNWVSDHGGVFANLTFGLTRGRVVASRSDEAAFSPNARLLAGTVLQTTSETSLSSL